MAAARAFLGMTHTPLLGLIPLAADLERDMAAAFTAVVDGVRAFAPDRIVMIGPDHYNGFFNELMPPLCIGAEASAVGDFKTLAGPLNTDRATALALADFMMDQDFDVALSYRMRVDHGFAQNLEQVFGSLATPPVVPVFLNSVSPPVILRIRRALAFGRALGRFLDSLPGRTLVMGSGGLSHEPPVPTMANPDPAVRERLTVKREATPEERAARMEFVKAAGLEMGAGKSKLKPLNPAWDKVWMDALESGRLEDLTGISEPSIVADAGLSGNESKTWLIARAALPAGVPTTTTVRFYREIPSLIAGYGVLFMQAGG